MPRLLRGERGQSTENLSRLVFPGLGEVSQAPRPSPQPCPLGPSVVSASLYSVSQTFPRKPLLDLPPACLGLMPRATRDNQGPEDYPGD